MAVNALDIRSDMLLITTAPGEPAFLFGEIAG